MGPNSPGLRLVSDRSTYYTLQHESTPEACTIQHSPVVIFASIPMIISRRFDCNRDRRYGGPFSRHVVSDVEEEEVAEVRVSIEYFSLNEVHAYFSPS